MTEVIHKGFHFGAVCWFGGGFNFWGSSFWQRSRGFDMRRGVRGFHLWESSYFPPVAQTALGNFR